MPPGTQCRGGGRNGSRVLPGPWRKFGVNPVIGATCRQRGIMVPCFQRTNRVDAILTPVSIGELIDKITILEIKAERIDDAAKLSNVRTELDGLLPLLQQQLQAQPALAVLKQQLKAINERMWDIQDQLRDKEAAQVFDDGFIQLARGVYGTNGERVQVKNEINRVAGSALVEEKQYQGE